MKYKREERLEIGRRIYNGEINRYEVAREYAISSDTARSYMRMYRADSQLPPRKGSANASETAQLNAEHYEAMSRDELIREIVQMKHTGKRPLGQAKT